MANDQATTHRCEVCKEAAGLLCPNCATGIDVHGQERKTYYCSKACQAKDWDAGHKLECKIAIDRRQLFRIGSLVQEAFYQSSKAIWFHDITEIKKIEHTERDDAPKLLVWCGEGQGGVDFPAFPDHLFEGDRDERATLASATSAVTIMSALVEDLVKGECLLLFSMFQTVTNFFSIKMPYHDGHGRHSPNGLSIHEICHR